MVGTSMTRKLDGNWCKAVAACWEIKVYVYVSSVVIVSSLWSIILRST